MRPDVLFSLFAPVAGLPGVGPRLAKALERLGIGRLVDLVFHLPQGIVDRRHAPKVARAPIGRVATLTIVVDRHEPPLAPRRPYRVVCSDETGTIVLVFFHARPEYLNRILPEGSRRVVSGTVERYGDQLQMTHPDHVGTPEERLGIMAVEPVYPLTEGLSPKVLARVVIEGLSRLPDLAEWQDATHLERQGWASWSDSLRRAHAPEDDAALAPQAPARARLAYDELLANQLALVLVRRQMRRLPGRPIQGDGALRTRLEAALPFTLTASQVRAAAEIVQDMAGPNRMLRLLQGDVGSGKTVVALLAMLTAVEAGAQAAFMAPTDVLARQHLATLGPLAEKIGVPLAILTAREKGKVRAAALSGLAEGRIPLVVGTHALFQRDVAFKDLALAVIDEQHRFGVHQRLTLSAKGKALDVLVMTATPIPRTLMLTAYGDMEASRLTEKPFGRRPIATRAVPLARLDDVVTAVGRALAAGGKVFWVCPLVSESETLDVAAAEARAEALRAVFGDRVGLVHGRLGGPEKDRVMADFADGPVHVLVATTVVEVGVDVPGATVMVIEHAERFGLAQLHQLRGRVGRGTAPSSCLLLHAPPLTATARARLNIMRETEDGFRIAEEDLRLRGAGELLGTRQSGLPDFRVADLTAHADLLVVARHEAKLITERDPELASPRGQALRTLLYLLERDAAVRYLRSG